MQKNRGGIDTREGGRQPPWKVLLEAVRTLRFAKQLLLRPADWDLGGRNQDEGKAGGT